MNMNKIKIFCLIFFLSISKIAFSAYGLQNRIDENSIFCEALGMSKAYTSFAEGVSGLYYNPAGIGQSSKNSVNLFFTKYFDSDAGFSFIGSNFKIKNYPVSSGIAHFRINNIPVRDEYGNYQRNTSTDELNIRIGSSHYFKKNIYYGGLIEIQRNDYDNKVHTGMGLGVGLLFKPIDKRLLNTKNFIGNAQQQLNGIAYVLFKDALKAEASGNMQVTKEKLSNILKIYPTYSKALRLFKKLYTGREKFSETDMIQQMDLYSGLAYEMQNLLKKSNFSDTTVNSLFFRGFDYFNRGELYAAILCWKTEKEILEKAKLRNRLSAGIFIKNIFGPSFGTERYPLSGQIGVGYIILPEKLRVAMDFSSVGTMQKSIHIGGEFLPIPQLAIRAGIGDSNFTFGIGLKFSDFDLNYVYKPFELGGYHMVDINYYFGKTNFQKAFTFMELGRLSADNQDYFNAEEDFKRSLAIDPSFTIAYHYLDKLQGQLRNARTNVKSMISKARDYAGKKDYVSAVRLLRKTVGIEPNNGTAVVLLEKMKGKKEYFEEKLNAMVQKAIHKNNYVTAESQILNLMKQQPTNSELKEKLSVLRASRARAVSAILANVKKEYRSNKFFNARNIIERAMQIDPENPIVKEKYEQILDKIAELRQEQNSGKLYNTYIATGKAALQQRKYTDAIINLNRALSLRPKSKKAFKYLKQAVKNYSVNVDKPYQQALAFYHSGKYKEALERLGLVLTVDPKHPMALKKMIEIKNAFDKFLNNSYTKARQLTKKQKYAEAINLFQMISDNNPKYKDTSKLLIKAQADYEIWKKQERGRELMRQAQPKFERGLRYTNEGKFTDAILAFNSAVEIYNKFYKAFYNIGICYDMLGKPRMAIAAYKKAIAANPDFAKAYHNIGVVYFMMGNRKKALFNLYKASKLDPDFKKTKKLIKIIKQNE